MVLLTSSTISVALSSGVVCVFTFLLFLSGYVLQQQTVRSIQAALHPPPTPTSTLPVYYQDEQDHSDNTTPSVIAATDDTGAQLNVEETQEPPLQALLTSIPNEPNPIALSQEQRQDEVEGQPSAFNEPNSDLAASEYSPLPSTTTEESNQLPLEAHANQVSFIQAEGGSDVAPALAYVQVLSIPSQICSALLFFKSQVEYGDQNIERVIVYPSFWEENTSSEPISNALALMQLVQAEYKITYHPVQINDASGAADSIERDLLAHLATNKWSYDRIIYLRGPGLALDIKVLDSCLYDAQTATLLSRQWIRANSPESSSPPLNIPPSSILLVTKQHSLHLPRGHLRRRLTAEVFVTDASYDEAEIHAEASAETAAYIHFVGDGDLLQLRGGNNDWSGSVFERYEHGRAEVCRGASFQE